MIAGIWRTAGSTSWPRSGTWITCFAHEPTAIGALLLTLGAAFLLTCLFHERNLKFGEHRPTTRLTLAACLRDEFALRAGAPVWPERQRSD